MRRFKSIIVASFVFAVAAIYSIGGAIVEAQSSASLSIAPRKDYVIESGNSVTDTVSISNIDSENDLNLNIRLVDFTYTDDGGSPKLLLDEDEPNTPYSLKPFVKLPESISIGPGGRGSFDVEISIPETHKAGSFYSAIVYSSGAPDGGNVGLSASGVTLAFVNVPGEVEEKLTLEKFGAYYKDDFVTFTIDKPQQMAYRLKNEGNVAQAPVGSITLKNMFGHKIDIANVNPNKQLALIGQTRTFTSCIKLQSEEVDFQGRATNTKACTEPTLWPGLYTAQLDVFYGQNGNQTQEVNGSTWFVYLPIWFLVTLTLAVALIAYLVYRIVRTVRGKKRSNKVKSL